MWLLLFHVTFSLNMYSNYAPIHSDIILSYCISWYLMISHVSFLATCAVWCVHFASVLLQFLEAKEAMDLLDLIVAVPTSLRFAPASCCLRCMCCMCLLGFSIHVVRFAAFLPLVHEYPRVPWVNVFLSVRLVRLMHWVPLIHFAPFVALYVYVCLVSLASILAWFL